MVFIFPDDHTTATSVHPATQAAFQNTKQMKITRFIKERASCHQPYLAKISILHQNWVYDMDKLRLLRWNNQSQSLRLRVTLGIIIPLIVLMGVFTAFEYSRQRRNDLNTLAIFSHQISRVIENDLRHQMLESDLKACSNCYKLLANSPR